MRLGSDTTLPHPGGEGLESRPAQTQTWAWLRQHEGSPRFGFLRRDGTGTLGAGVLDTIEGPSLGEVLAETQRRGGTWFVGGSFDPVRARDPWWAPFGAARAWRPRTLHGLPAPRQATAPQAPRNVALQAPAHGQSPDRAAWGELVEHAVSTIARGDLEKVVLARSIIEAAEVDAITWLRRPRAQREMAFLYEPEPGRAFAGMTPELLFDRSGERLQSEALAGTDVNTPGGRERLLASEKDAREHALVVEAVAERLGPLCAELHRSPLALACMGKLVHRLVSFEGRVRPGLGDAAIVDALHPTPAVAGTPNGAALSYLREHEPFDRGWYAGPVGLVEPGRTTLSVALRCALWLGTTRVAFVGAGIVKGSVPQAEWDETELKSRVVRNG